MRRHFWFLVVTLAGGINLLVLDKPHVTLPGRIAWHLTGCATPFAAYVIGLKIRGMRWRHEFLPLIERLRAIDPNDLRPREAMDLLYELHDLATAPDADH